MAALFALSMTGIWCYFHKSDFRNKQYPMPMDGIAALIRQNSTASDSAILVDSTKYGLALGDGVNTKTEGFNNSFPYLMPANSGRNSAHTGPGQAGCTGQSDGICPVN